MKVTKQTTYDYVAEVLYWAWQHSLESNELAEHLDISDAEMAKMWEHVNYFRRHSLPNLASIG